MGPFGSPGRRRYGTSRDKIGLLSQKAIRKVTPPRTFLNLTTGGADHPERRQTRTVRGLSYAGGSLGRQLRLGRPTVAFGRTFVLDSEICCRLNLTKSIFLIPPCCATSLQNSMSNEVLRAIAAGEESEDDDSDL
jgi:hypothetical protein